MGRVEIGHSSETLLIQETKGENLPREWHFRPLCGAVNYCVFSRSELPGSLPPWTHWGFTVPPAELGNRDLPQMRIGGQRTAFEIHHCGKCRDLLSCCFSSFICFAYIQKKTYIVSKTKLQGE